MNMLIVSIGSGHSLPDNTKPVRLRDGLPTRIDVEVDKYRRYMVPDCFDRNEQFPSNFPVLKVLAEQLQNIQFTVGQLRRIRAGGLLHAARDIPDALGLHLLLHFS